MNKKTLYEITLKDGKKIVLWFMGKSLEKILKDYNIPYKIKEEM
jgi:hypothetical protein